MNGRRSNIEIIAGILRLREASKTQIMYRVSMSYAQLQKYLEYLLGRGFLSWDPHEYRGGIYRITHEGESLLQSIEKIEELLTDRNGSKSLENMSQFLSIAKNNEKESQRTRTAV